VIDLAELWGQAVLVCTAAGILAGLISAARTLRLIPSLRLAVEFWVAAGLLRLSSDPTWSTLAGAAGILAIRQLVQLGIRQA